MEKEENASIVLGKRNVTTAKGLAVEMSCKLRDSRGGEGEFTNGTMFLGIG